MTDEKPICRNCRWSHIGLLDRLLLGWKFARCLHSSGKRPAALFDALVDGRAPYQNNEDFLHCTTSRQLDCGPEARFFEARS